MVNRRNYLLVKEHLKYLEEVHQLSENSIRRYWFYLRHLLIWADETFLGKIIDKRPTFPAYVSTLPGKQKDGPLSASAQKKIIETSKRLFLWAKSAHPKEFQSTPANWIETLRPPRMVQQPDEHEYVSLEQVIQLATFQIEESDLALQRDQAAAAMLFLSGMRASAFTTLPISAIDIPNQSVKQWPELGVKTKNGKRATTYLLPIPELLAVVEEWDCIVRLALPSTSSWYAPIESQWSEQSFSTKSPGKNRNQALNKRLRILFEAAGLEYMSAHKFRHGHAVYGLQHAQKMADYKAVSMNLMHEDIKVTDQIYAPILSDEVKQRISTLGSQSSKPAKNQLLDQIDQLSNEELSQLLSMAAERLTS